jgi:flagellar hook-associated protein 1 FlgK
MATNFLSTGISGLLAFQRALDTTSHNIANVGTEGYSRQRTEFLTRPATLTGNGYVGNGVEIATTRRIYDDLLAGQVRTSSSTFSSMDTFATYVNRVNNLFSDTTTGLSATLQKFVNALQDVTNNPSSIASRQVLLSEAGGLTDRLKSYDAQLATFDQQVESQLKSEATEISTLASSIAQLNQEITNSQARFGQPANDLLDQRDHLIDQLSTHIDVSTVAQGDGSVNVFIGTGQALVVGATASKVTTVADAYDATRHGIGIIQPGGNTVNVTGSMSGGTLGGLLDFRSHVLDPARNALGRISVALADVMNEQHREGIDLNGALGGDFFGIGAPTVLGNTANTGGATVTASIADAGALTEANYYLEKTATGWSLKRDDTGASITLSGTGTAADPFTADGLSIVIGGTAANTGDRFLIQPTRSATAGLAVLVTDPGKIAAAAPIRTEAAAANTGSGKISAGTVVDASDPALRSTVTIQFTDATHYTVNGAGSFTYTSGSPITINGWEVEISGAPAAGDAFTIKDNSGGTGDNRNAQALVDSLNAKVLDSGTTSINDATTRLIGGIGVTARQAQASRDAQSVIKQEAVDARDSVSGVNLDEEAANMLRYQQAYQAAAQIISVANTLFDSLLAATRR